MTTLNLQKLWVNLLATGDAVAGYTDPGRSREHSIEGEVRTYAGGRQRAIHVKGERGQFGFTMKDLTLDQVETLRGWVGMAVSVRDHRGQRYVGAYFGLGVEEVKTLMLYNVSISLQMLTISEGV